MRPTSGALALAALWVLGACASPRAASDAGVAPDAGARGRDLMHLVTRDASPEPDARALLTPLEDAPDAGHVADAAQVQDAAQGALEDAAKDAEAPDAGPVYACTPGRLDCDGVAANGCELLAWDAGCAGLSLNGMRCVDCAGGELCACGKLLAGSPKCVSLCD